MSFGYQLIARCGPHEHLTDVSEELELPAPIGRVHVRTMVPAPGEPGELVLRSVGFGDEETAVLAGTLLRDWVRISSAVHLRGLDVGPDPIVRSELSPPHSQVQVVPDVVGLVVFEWDGRPVRRFNRRAEPGLTRDFPRLLGGILEAAADVHRPLPEHVALACDLLSTAAHDPCDEHGLMRLLAAAEALTVRRSRTGLARETVERLLAMAKQAERGADPDERAELESIVRSVGLLRLEPAWLAVRDLARCVEPDEPKEAVALVDDAYAYRSCVVFGRRPPVDVELFTRFRRLVQSMVRHVVYEGAATNQGEVVHR